MLKYAGYTACFPPLSLRAENALSSISQAERKRQIGPKTTQIIQLLIDSANWQFICPIAQPYIQQISQMTVMIDLDFLETLCLL